MGRRLAAGILAGVLLAGCGSGGGHKPKQLNFGDDQRFIVLAQRLAPTTRMTGHDDIERAVGRQVILDLDAGIPPAVVFDDDPRSGNNPGDPGGVLNPIQWYAVAVAAVTVYRPAMLPKIPPPP